MAYNTQKIKDKAETFTTNNSMRLAASSFNADAGEEEVRESVAKIVSAMLEELPSIITWFISEEWAAKLVARVVEAIGETILEWL